MHDCSHAWNCKFKDLLMLIESHYSRIVESTGGVAYVPVFYWVDVLAVTQVGAWQMASRVVCHTLEGSAHM